MQTLLRNVLLVQVLLLQVAQPGAQTIVPRLDQEGRKGDVARMQAEKARQSFAAADANGDGQLSRDEVAGSRYQHDNFDKNDRNKDGFLSWEEYVGHNRWPRHDKQ